MVCDIAKRRGREKGGVLHPNRKGICYQKIENTYTDKATALQRKSDKTDS